MPRRGGRHGLLEETAHLLGGPDLHLGTGFPRLVGSIGGVSDQPPPAHGVGQRLVEHPMHVPDHLGAEPTLGLAAAISQELGVEGGQPRPIHPGERDRSDPAPADVGPGVHAVGGQGARLERRLLGREPLVQQEPGQGLLGRRHVRAGIEPAEQLGPGPFGFPAGGEAGMPLLAPPFAVEEGAAAVRTGREWLATEPHPATALLADLAGHVATEVDDHGPTASVLADVTTHDESSLLGQAWLVPASDPGRSGPGS